MNRREYLRATGVSVPVTAIAGCLGIGSDDRDPPDVMVDPSQIEGNSVSDAVKQSAEDILTGLDHLNRGFQKLEQSLNDFSGITDTGDYTVDGEDIREQLRLVDASLTSAEDGAADRQQQLIDGLREMLDSFQGAVTVLESVNNAVTSYSQWENAARSGDASTMELRFSEFQTFGGQAFDGLETVQAPFNRVDEGVYLATDEITEGRVTSYLNEMVGVVAVTRKPQDGVEELTEAVAILEVTEPNLGTENWEDVTTGLEDAEEAFDNAHSEFVSGQDGLLRHYQHDIAALMCAAETAREATHRYIEAVAERQDGNQQATTEKIMDAAAELNECPYDIFEEVFVPYREQI